MDPAPVLAMEDPVLLGGRVLNTLLESENVGLLDNYMATSNMNERSQNILVEWMKEVCEETRREEEVFSPSVTILDKFFSKNVERENCQLADAVCMFLSCLTPGHLYLQC